jgi:isopenicillin N synthase-like dioxygenase
MVPNLQVVSNDDCKSVEHKVVLKSIQEARVSIALLASVTTLTSSALWRS